MAKLHEGGDVHVDYKLMPLTAEETNAGGEYLGARYAVEHQDRWIDVNHLIFELQTYDRGYTTVRIQGRTYAIYQDILEGDLNVRLFIGRYIGTPREDVIGGIQTMEVTPKNIFTWKELVDLGVVNDSPNLAITYTKLLDENERCLIGNTVTGGVRLVIPQKTTSGEVIKDIFTTDAETKWSNPTYPTRYICEVVLPEGLTSIGLSGSAFPVLGKNVVCYETSVKVPSTVATIGKKAFYGSNLKILSGSKFCEFTGDDALATIDESAFENCTELATVHFGESLKTVGTKAFYGCKKAQICFRNTIQTVAEDACYMVGNVEYRPRVKEGKTIPKVVSDAPFQAKLWNGKHGYTPGYYTKPIVFPEPDNPTIMPPPVNPGGDNSDSDRTPLDLSGVIKQINTINTVPDNIEAPR